MGKAKILSGGENGLYTIELDYGDEERDKVVEKLAGRLKELAPQLDEAKAKLDEAKGKENASKDATKEATDEYVAATKVVPVAFKAVTTATNDLPGKAAALQQAIGWLKSVTAMEPPASPEQLASAEAAVAAADAAHKSAQGALKTAEAKYAQAQDDVKTKMDAQVAAAKELVAAKKETAPLELAHELLKDERSQLIKDRSYYAGLHLVETRKAWCADLTEDAKDEVATIEIPGDSNLVLINAGAGDGGTVDGVLFAREMQSPEQVFWNAAVLPGWQKWKPTYRRGTITALDLEANTADVALEEETSTGQKLNINQTKTLEKVPVNYMGCNAEAFEVGDACVVRFDDMNWETPRVMGFVDNPKACPGGIGVEMDDGTVFILRPTAAAGGQWKSRAATELHGGVAYAVNGGLSFVESGQGLCRSNKRVAEPIYGATSAPYLQASVDFPVSGLFISDGEVRQATARDNALVVGGYTVKKLPSGNLPELSCTLPSAADGEAWGMVTANEKGDEIVVCRTREGDEAYGDDGGVFPYVPGGHVLAVAHCTTTPQIEKEPAKVELGDVQTLNPYTTRTPTASSPDGDMAPKWGTFAGKRGATESYSWTPVDDPEHKPGDPVISWLEIATGSIFVEYQENSEFEFDGVFRAYIGHEGELITEPVKRVYRNSINSRNALSYYTYENVWRNSYAPHTADHDNTGNRKSELIAYEEITFFGKHKLKTYETRIDFLHTDSTRATTTLTGAAFGVGTGRQGGTTFAANISTAAQIKRELNSVVVADEQFGVLIAVKIALAYNVTLLSDRQRITTITTFPDSTETNVSTASDDYVLEPLEVSLEIIGNNSMSIEINADSSREQFEDSSKADLKSVFLQLNTFVGAPGREKKFAYGTDDGDEDSGGLIRQDNDLLQNILDRWARAQWTAKYAKDPKTGVGFLSFRWGDETKNYVVGPWGVEPSSSRTEVASDAKVSRVVSV